MARSDLLLKLVKAGVNGDQDVFRTTAESIAAEERAKKHTVIAGRLERILDTKSTPSLSSQNFRVTEKSGGIHDRIPRKQLSDLYLEKALLSSCTELIEEQARADLLRANGLEPRHRLLLIGPPGNGKTSLAEAIAYELALPFFTVRYDSVVTSFLGETAQRLKRLFDYVKTQPCVLFFDEFDAIGKERGDIHETGEIKRVVTTLLLNIDALPSYCVLIGATNHPELLDKATWRRFELRLKLGKPTDSQMAAYFSDQLKKLNGTPGYTAKRLYAEIKPRSFSEAENFFLDIQRRIILNRGEIAVRSIIADRVRAWNENLSIPKESVTDGPKTNS